MVPENGELHIAKKNSGFFVLRNYARFLQIWHIKKYIYLHSVPVFTDQMLHSFVYAYCGE